MNKKICAITGSTPNEYSFGYDEENMNCALEKRLIVQAIFALVSVGVTGFLSTMNEGAELWGAEAVAHIITTFNRDITLGCVPTSEEQASRWHPDTRDKYFDLLENYLETDAIPKRHDPDGDMYGADRELFGEDIYAYDADKYIADTADMLLVCGDKPGVHAEILMREFEGRGKKIMRMNTGKTTGTADAR